MATFINLVVIRVADLEKSRQFYEALGLKLSLERHGKGPEHLSAEIDNLIFELYPQGKMPASSSARLGFRVASVLETVSAIEQLGTEIILPPTESPWGLRAVVVDFDGHRIELTQ